MCAAEKAANRLYDGQLLWTMLFESAPPPPLATAQKHLYTRLHTLDAGNKRVAVTDQCCLLQAPSSGTP